MGCLQSKQNSQGATGSASAHRAPPCGEALTEPVGAKFELLARLLGKLFSVPMVVITTVDGRQLCLRAAESVPPSEQRMSLACWQQIIDHPGCLVVEDAKHDERLAAADPGGCFPSFGFYAGVALVGADGRQFGTLSIVDEVPRTFPPEAAKILGNCGCMLARELEREALAASKGHQAVQAEEVGHMEELCRRCDASGDALMVLCLCRRVTEVEQWHILHANAAWQQATGLTGEQALGQNFWKLFQPENPDLKEHPVLVHDDAIELRRPFKITVCGKVQSRTLVVSLWPAENDGSEGAEDCASGYGAIYLGLVSKPEIVLSSVGADAEQPSQAASAPPLVLELLGRKAVQDESPMGSPRIAAQRSAAGVVPAAAAEGTAAGVARAAGLRGGKQQAQGDSLQHSCTVACG